MKWKKESSVPRGLNREASLMEGVPGLDPPMREGLEALSSISLLSLRVRSGGGLRCEEE